ncbi:hypothetical protein TCAL_16025 [Tigriopus californicus]|uniref:Uncharacterized protein n=1 Tax=Tigriopus californicus TaxID=6832 RepID=A0A553PP87_TIGCA|nr:hypothetical protein TCAL_16025 [Tigriopus californicus]
MEISNSFDKFNGHSLRSNHGQEATRYPLARLIPSSRKPSLQSLRSRDDRLDVLRSTLRSLKNDRLEDEDTATLRSHHTLRRDKPTELTREDFSSVVNYDQLPPPKPIQATVQVLAAIADVADGSLFPRGAYPVGSQASSRRSSFHSRGVPLTKSRQPSLNSYTLRCSKDRPNAAGRDDDNSSLGAFS